MLNKRLLPSLCLGPYVVASQPTTASLVLYDPADGRYVDDGSRIPLDQIVAGPTRARLEFEKDSDANVGRPYSAMVGKLPFRYIAVAHRSLCK